jgi:hypothetical protein
LLLRSLGSHVGGYPALLSARFYERFFGMKEMPSPDFPCTLAEGSDEPLTSRDA